MIICFPLPCYQFSVLAVAELPCVNVRVAYAGPDIIIPFSRVSSASPPSILPFCLRSQLFLVRGSTELLSPSCLSPTGHSSSYSFLFLFVLNNMLLTGLNFIGHVTLHSLV